ncbi:hypothetical protein BX661DRAFT_181378 [Kickxella alabastrina]|uniref:uncharacterized protein n=1 Tax=Kickxella alabastrina TaxID=61397 RepID=UPI00221EE9B6|nr:uncharacterized protein BX661DRAFT_181378 [Kickxella alabastrina]KAI7829103.1 hypothetical protein BX661DRAFT_181378 [Kickxella alabastrina]
MSERTADYDLPPTRPNPATTDAGSPANKSMASPVRQYASINTVPSLQEHTAASKAGAIGATAAPISNRASLDGSGALVPLNASSFSARGSSVNLSDKHIDAEANLPFTYSDVFSPDAWKTPTAPHASALCAGGMSSESEDSDDLDDDSDSDTESYEGLAVDDINETYDHSLPEYVPNPDPFTQSIYLEEEGIMISVRGMSYSSMAVWMYSMVGILTLGISNLLCRWIPTWKIRWTMRPAHLGEAEFVVVEDEFGSIAIKAIQRRFYGGTLESIFGSLTRKGPLHEHNDDVVSNLSMFSHRYYRFVYHPYLEKFLPNACWMDSKWTRLPMGIRTGLSQDICDLRSTIFGDNNIEIEEKPTAKLLFDEVLNPFYMFQVGSVILWCFDDYYYYAACILIISVSGIVETLFETRRNTRKIKEMAHFSCIVRILRDGTWRDGSAEELLPGDVFEVTSGMYILPCDAVLLEGDCIVNESMLTGESVPVAKVPVVPAVFGKMRLASSTFGSEIAKHVLFSGTRLVRVKKTGLGFGGMRWLELDHQQQQKQPMTGTPARATAMVLRTGFNTTKGALIRSILFPRPNKFKFYEDSFRFIGILAVIAAFGFLASIGNFLRLGLSAHIITVRALDLITVVVPPALPATMSIGVSFALSRLRKRHIYCISPTRINVCGKINAMVFDKTGTLSELDLDVLGLHPADPDSNRFGELQEDPRLLPLGPAAAPSAPSSAFSSANSTYALGLRASLGGLASIDRSFSMTSPVRRLADPSKLSVMHALASCHAVKLVDGQYVGDPLDVKMLESTGWVLEEEGDDLALGSIIALPNAAGRGASIPIPAVVRPPNADRFTLDGTGGSNVYELGIIRAFDFSASLRRQSVIAKRLGARYNEVYVKGAPEAIRELCYSDTIPRDFDSVLLEYTNHGYRVIALAGKPLKMSWPKLQRLKRDAVESELIFLGFLIFENKLKPTTAPVIRELRAAKIRQIMCTGDNVLTAISVGRECGMVPEGMRVFIPRLIRRKEAEPPAPAPANGGANGSVQVSDSESSVSASGGNGEADVRAMVVWEDAEDELCVLDPYTLEPRAATAPVKDKLVTSDIAETSAEMQRQQQHYFNWLHNYTNPDAELTSGGNYCVAVTGEVFRYIMDTAPDTTVGRILMRGAIYARMSPDEKGELVERLQAIGYCVGFCGDGANDCGALRAADVGLSLSEAEASVAAPFTSHSTDIQCVLEVIREGRAALVTSFSCFKYMALYSIIQFTSVSMLYEFGGGLGDSQFLYIDLFIIVPLAIFMGRTPAYHSIVPKRPTANLMSKKVLTSLFGQIAINSTIQAIVFRMVKNSANYTPPVREDPGDLDSLLIKSFENTALFLISSFQYILVACVFSIGPPYRQSNMRNTGLFAACALLVAFTVYMVMWPNDWINNVFELVNISESFRRTVIVCAIINFGLSSAGERWLFPWLAPTVAKLGRIIKYICHRHVMRRFRGQYTKLQSFESDSDSRGSQSNNGAGSSAATFTLGEGDTAGLVSSPVTRDAHRGNYSSELLESGCEPLSWEEIARKSESKQYKRILCDMGIPAWY